MSNVISFENKLKTVKESKDATLQQRKILTVQKALQCFHCAIKCEKCGMQVSSGCSGHQQHACTGCHAPYRFCDSCNEEYLDYIEYLKGSPSAGCYWQNGAWAETWQRWIDYQASVDRYYKTKEFKRLVDEMRQKSSDL